MARRRDKSEERDIAAARIATLLARARGEALRGDAPIADRYAYIAIGIVKKYQTGLPRDAKAQVCRACGAYRIPGRTSRTRMTGGRITTTCLRCGNIARRIMATRVAAVRTKTTGSPSRSAPGRDASSPSRPGVKADSRNNANSPK